MKRGTANFDSFPMEENRRLGNGEEPTFFGCVLALS
jgi:hypothetical protein